MSIATSSTVRLTSDFRRTSEQTLRQGCVSTEMREMKEMRTRESGIGVEGGVDGADCADGHKTLAQKDA